MTADSELLSLIALKKTPNIGPVNARNLIRYCGSASAVFSTGRNKLLRIPGIGNTIASAVTSRAALNDASRELRLIRDNDISVCTWTDPDYPGRLAQFDTSPLVLYTRGKMDLNRDRTIAIVGTRNPTNYGRMQTARLLERLAEYDVTVISGLAYGVDVIAHRTAMALGLQTIGVLGNGLKSIYPPAHLRTAAEMEKNGGVISEFDFSAGPEKDNFPARNRIIAGLADAVLVIESGLKGGSMITAEFAGDCNREVFALPGRVDDRMSGGCLSLIKKHRAHLFETAEDVAYIMGWDQTAGVFEGRQHSIFGELSDEEKLISDLIMATGESPIDSLVLQSGFDHTKLSSILLSLECKSVIMALPGKRFCKMP